MSTFSGFTNKKDDLWIRPGQEQLIWCCFTFALGAILEMVPHVNSSLRTQYECELYAGLFPGRYNGNTVVVMQPYMP